VVVSGEGELNIELLHDHKGSAIDQRPSFVGARFAEMPSGSIDLWRDVDEMHEGCGFNGVQDAEEAGAGGAEGTIEECDEFTDDVVGCKENLFLVARFLKQCGG